MAPLPLLYVHGAGPQQPAPAFKHEADMILFGRTCHDQGRPLFGGPLATVQERSDRRPEQGRQDPPGRCHPRLDGAAGQPDRGRRRDRVRHADGAASPRDEVRPAQRRPRPRPMSPPPSGWSRSSTGAPTWLRADRRPRPPAAPSA